MSVSFVPLGELVDFKGGGTPNKKIESYWNGGIPWASVKDFKSTELGGTLDTISDDGLKNSASNLIPQGTIIVPTRMAVGKAAISTIDLAINQDLKALLPKGDFETRYLLHVLLASGHKLARRATGATVKGITLSVLRELEIPLPPLPEQQRIAAILDQADTMRRLRRQSLSRLSDLGQAIFFEMFGDPVPNPHNWPKVPLSECVASADDIRCGPFGTQLLREEFTEAGVPLWGIKQVNKGFAIQTHEFVPEAKARALSNYDIVPGDIVMTRKGTIGNCAVYPHDFPPGVMHSDLLRLRLDQNSCDPLFLSDQLHWSIDIERQIELISGGAIMKGINVGKLKQIKVLLPPMKLQSKYVERMRAARQEESRMLQHLGEIECLFASLQHRAFRGEL